jgi:hypothetical protein
MSLEMRPPLTKKNVHCRRLQPTDERVRKLSLQKKMKRAICFTPEPARTEMLGENVDKQGIKVDDNLNETFGFWPREELTSAKRSSTPTHEHKSDTDQPSEM